jgi:hypothetical protein
MADGSLKLRDHPATWCTPRARNVGALQERREGSRRQKALLQYEAKGRAVREKTARLRAIRLDKEAAEKNEGVAAGAGQPLVARKKVKHGC